MVSWLGGDCPAFLSVLHYPPSFFEPSFLPWTIMSWAFCEVPVSIVLHLHTSLYHLFLSLPLPPSLLPRPPLYPHTIFPSFRTCLNSAFIKLYIYHSDRMINFLPIRAVGWGRFPCTAPISGTPPCTPCRRPRTPFSHRQSGTGTRPTRPRHPWNMAEGKGVSDVWQE